MSCKICDFMTTVAVLEPWKSQNKGSLSFYRNAVGKIALARAAIIIIRHPRVTVNL